MLFLKEKGNNNAWKKKSTRKNIPDSLLLFILSVAEDKSKKSVPYYERPNTKKIFDLFQKF